MKNVEYTSWIEGKAIKSEYKNIIFLLKTYLYVLRKQRRTTDKRK